MFTPQKQPRAAQGEQRIENCPEFLWRVQKLNSTANSNHFGEQSNATTHVGPHQRLLDAPIHFFHWDKQPMQFLTIFTCILSSLSVSSAPHWFSITWLAPYILRRTTVSTSNKKGMASSQSPAKPIKLLTTIFDTVPRVKSKNSHSGKILLIA